MSTDLNITIKATDGSSAVFQKVGSAAKTMASSLEQAGSQGASSLGKVAPAADKAAGALGKLSPASDKAASSVSKLDTAFSKVSSGAQKFSATGAAVGAALSGMVGVLSDAARAAAEADAVMRRLEATFEGAGADIGEYEEALERAGAAAVQLGIDDEAAMDAIGRMIQISGDAAGSIDNLGLVMDLAAARGISLETAAQAVGRAMTGNFSQLTRMGVVVEEGATAYEVLSAAQQTFAGQAEANSTVMDRVAVAAGNMQEELGAAVGPFQGLLAVLPGISSGFQLVGTAVGGFGPAMGKAASAATSAGSGFKTLLGAISPTTAAFGLVGAAVAAAAVSFVAHQRAVDDMAASYRELSAAVQEVDSSFLRGQFRDLGIAADEVEGIAEKIFGATDAFTGTGLVNDFTANVDNWNRALADLSNQGDQSAVSLDHLQQAAYTLDGAMQSAQIGAGDAADALADMNAVLDYTGPGAAELQATLAGLVRMLNEGTLSPQQFAAALDAMTDDIGAAGDASIVAADGVDTLNDSLARTPQVIAAQVSALSQLSTQTREFAAIQRMIADQQREQALNKQSLDAYQAMTFAMGEYAAVAELAGQASADEAARQAEAQAAAEALASTLRGALVPALDGAAGGFAKLVGPGEDVLDVLDRMRSGMPSAGRALTGLADQLNDAAQGMQSALSVFGSIDTLGGLSEQAAKISEELVNWPGYWGEIDNMRARGTLTEQTYNAALEAGHQILADNVAVQENLNAVRAATLPLLAEQERALLQSTAALAQMAQTNPELAQQALYLQDAGNQAKLAAAYSTAYAASLGEIPADVATEIIANGAQADPVLADILERMGLIEVGADGEIRVNFPDAATLDDVTTSIDRLNNTVAEVGIAISGDQDLESLKVDLDEVDGKDAQATATVTDNGTVEETVGRIDEIDGKQVEVSIVATLAEGAANLLNAGADFLKAKTQEINVSVTVDESELTALYERLGSERTDRAVIVDVQANAATFDATLSALGAGAAPVIVDIQGNAATFDRTLGSLGSGAAPVIVDIQGNKAQFEQALAGISRTAAPVIVDIQANRAGFDGALRDAESAGQGFAGRTFAATLDATDQSGSAIAQAMQAGNAWATTYTGTLAATDSASSVVAQAMQAANAFAVTYTATLAVSDDASGPIGSAQSAAAQFASTYQATLSAADNASGVISSVQSALTSLDGQTATVYVNAVDNTGGAVTGRRLGGAVLPEVPRAAMGRMVQVGEAGPELAVLPFGTQVVPHGAAQSRAAAEQGKASAAGLLGKFDTVADAKRAYEDGKKTADAFFGGLLAKLDSRLGEAKSAFRAGFIDQESADKAVAEYDRAARARERLQAIARKARQEEKAAAREQAREEAAAADAMAATAEATESATAATGELAQGLGEAAAAAAGLTDGLAQNRIAAEIGKVIDSLGSVTDAAADAGAGIEDGLESGAKDAARGVGKSVGRIDGSLEDAADDAEDHGEEMGDNLADGVEKSDARKRFDEIFAAVQKAASADYTTKLDADNSKLEGEVKDASTDLTRLKNGNYDPKVSVDIDDAALDRLRNELESLDGQTFNVTMVVKEKERDGGGGGGSQGKRLGGTVRPLPPAPQRVPAAALGRTVLVGEAGPELAFLPYGTQVMPHGASQSRMRAEGLGGGTVINVYGTFHVHPPDADVGRAIQRQALGIGR